MPPQPGYHPGPLIIPNAVEVLVEWTAANGKTTHNRLGGIVSGGFAAGTGSAQSIYAGIVGSSQWTAFKAYINSSCSIVAVLMRDLRSANLPLWRSTGSPVAGTGAGGALPPEVAYVITERTALAGRAFRGRIYTGSLDKTAVTSAGVADPTFQTDCLAFWNEVETQMLAQGIQLAVLSPQRDSYVSPSTGRTIPARAAVATGVASLENRDNVMDSQRRRSRP